MVSDGKDKSSFRGKCKSLWGWYKSNRNKAFISQAIVTVMFGLSNWLLISRWPWSNEAMTNYKGPDTMTWAPQSPTSFEPPSFMFCSSCSSVWIWNVHLYLYHACLWALALEAIKATAKVAAKGRVNHGTHMGIVCVTWDPHPTSHRRTAKPTCERWGPRLHRNPYVTAPAPCDCHEVVHNFGRVYYHKMMMTTTLWQTIWRCEVPQLFTSWGCKTLHVSTVWEWHTSTFAYIWQVLVRAGSWSRLSWIGPCLEGIVCLGTADYRCCFTGWRF